MSASNPCAVIDVDIAEQDEDGSLTRIVKWRFKIDRSVLPLLSPDVSAQIIKSLKYGLGPFGVTGEMLEERVIVRSVEHFARGCRS